MASVETGLRLSKLALVINAALAAVKITAGVLGHSYVLIADGIESTADIFSSVVVWSGLREKAEAYAFTLQQWHLTAVLEADEAH